MDSRGLFDIALVVVAGLLAYTETFGFANPRTTLQEIIAAIARLDIRVFLVLGGIFGICFVAYLTMYLPQKDARTIQR
ncbi:hypothetical protein HISP_01820 [Haloarcula hispanica N601]|jgi:hypothetical protein|uniref:Uncharacterized protein n=3 Tax=Haloarcula hispanica TaxID=51589 RepID=A0A482T7M0_HALHI|nr:MULTISPECIES: hypothetical protein [Haloarcula]AEM55973.1 conserved hypothetical protein [Haloarcula hispanica ATCC 33960]AHB64793.1 hypothetical protein HISP_01820 [Haloarcula hispanica N601]AJF25964.1 hypothetical protein SG26_09630 [Haloarcula sp. CBA1115]KAA9405397.1 hypothetical protein Har1131_00655 [Haloarcula sp. CBA1131]KAA9408723.1 hypothetical protein EGO51_02635 [Haloarcula hispanica]